MDNKPNNIDINFFGRDTYPNLLFKERVAPHFAKFLKSKVSEGKESIPNSEILELFQSLYGAEYEDMKKIYEAFGGNPEGFSPQRMASSIDSMRIPLDGRKKLYYKKHGDKSSIFVSDLENIADPAERDGVQRYTKFDPDTFYGTKVGDNLMVGEYTDNQGRLVKDNGAGIAIPSVEGVLEGLNRAAKGKKHKEEIKTDAGMDIVSRFLPGNDKTYSSRLVVKDPHSLVAPIVVPKNSGKPQIESLSYEPKGNPSIELEEMSYPNNGLYQDTPSRYDNKITKSSVHDIRGFLRGQGNSNLAILPVRRALADSVGRISDKVDTTKLPNTPEELYHKEISPVDSSQIPSKEELIKDLKEIRKSMEENNSQVFSELKEMLKQDRMNNVLSNFSDFENFKVQTKFYDHNSGSRKFKDALWSIAPLGGSAIAGNNRRLVGVGTDLSTIPLGLIPVVGGPAAMYYGYKAPRQVRADMQGLDNPKVRKKLKELYEKGIEEIEAIELAKMLKTKPEKLFKKDWANSMGKSFRYTFDDVPFEESQENFAVRKFFFKGKPGNAKIASQFLSESVANRSEEELKDLLKALAQRSSVGTQKGRFFRDAKQSLGSALEQYYGTDTRKVWDELEDFYVKNNIKPSFNPFDPSAFQRYPKGVLMQTGDNASSGVYRGIERGLENKVEGKTKKSLLRTDKGVDPEYAIVPQNTPSKVEDVFVVGDKGKTLPGVFHTGKEGIGHTGGIVALGTGAGAAAAASKVRDAITEED